MHYINTELNDLKLLICLRMSKVSVKGITVFNVIEKLAEHGILCLPCSRINKAMNTTIASKNSH